MTNRKFQKLLASAATMLAAALLGTQTRPATAQTPPETGALYAYVGSFTTAQRKAREIGRAHV